MLQKEERDLKRKQEKGQIDVDSSEQQYKAKQELYKKEDLYNRVKEQYGIVEVDEDLDSSSFFMS